MAFVSDNGPQFSAGLFADFSKEFGFTHVTSSPHYLQANGAAERGVRTVKSLLNKSTDDPYSALLAYRATPLENGYSPTELLMGRKLRTTIPKIQKQLLPYLPDKSAVKVKEKIRKRQESNFNKHHNARQLRPLQTGEQVYIPDNSSNGTVIDEPSPRSYNVQTSGGIYRRNRRQLLPLPTESVTPEDLPPNTCCTKSGGISKPPERLTLRDM